MQCECRFAVALGSPARPNTVARVQAAKVAVIKKPLGKMIAHKSGGAGYQKTRGSTWCFAAILPQHISARHCGMGFPCPFVPRPNRLDLPRLPNPTEL